MKDSLKAAAIACATFALIESAMTLWAAPTLPGFFSLIRFVLLAVALSSLLWLVLGVVFSLTTLVSALTGRLFDRPSDAPGPFAKSPDPEQGSGHGPLAWAGFVFSLTFVGSSAWLITKAVPRYKNLLLTALLIAVVQVGLAGVAAATGWLAHRGTRALGKRLAPRFGAANPFARGLPAAAVIGTLLTASLIVFLAKAPHYRPFVPWRYAISMLAIFGGIYIAKRTDWPVGLWTASRRSKQIIAAAMALLIPPTLLWWGADPEAKAMAVTSSPALGLLVDGVRRSNDFDGDGYGSLLGETDCAPFNSSMHPLAPEIPDNGRDENCDGRDLELANLVHDSGTTPPVPAPFVRDWNILLITVDTVRYDRTSFGGYRAKSGRDTTPNLAQLVARSASFSFCNAPSAGTMASIPSILTSKFFHSGIALGPNRKGQPPVTKPGNLLIAEIMKSAGYKTGAILTHHYFNDWGLEQGFDTYDNSIGEKSKPRDVSSDRVTDRAVSWIAGRGKKKWFLWTHYLDPHGRYVAHPGEKSYGTSEEDLYDGELHYTDKELGRLFREMARMPGVAENTIIILTSDHGDAFNEHGFINHGQALYSELLWVPLIIYIPSIQPRVIPGPVSPLDIVPTVLDLTGIDRKRLRFEGESLVAQLFYGETAEKRVVFAETDWPKPQRAAISNNYKLIRKLQDNLFELYDLKKDPLEKKNIYRTDKKGFDEINAHLERWLERVYYARDQVSNQQMMHLGDHLLSEPPKGEKPVEISLLDGKIELFGFDVKPLLDKKKKVTNKIVVSTYFKSKTRVAVDLSIQVLAWPTGERASAKRDMGVIRSSSALTAKGRLPSSRWRPGEIIRHESVLVVRKQPMSGKWSFAVAFKTKTTVSPDPAPTLKAGRVTGSTELGTIEFEPEASVVPAIPPKPVIKQRTPTNGIGSGSSAQPSP